MHSVSHVSFLLVCLLHCYDQTFRHLLPSASCPPSCWLRSAQDTEDGKSLIRRQSILWQINILSKNVEVHCQKFTASAGPSAFFGNSQWLLGWSATAWEHQRPADKLIVYSYRFSPRNDFKLHLVQQSNLQTALYLQLTLHNAVLFMAGIMRV